VRVSSCDSSSCASSCESSSSLRPGAPAPPLGSVGEESASAVWDSDDSSMIINDCSSQDLCTAHGELSTVCVGTVSQRRSSGWQPPHTRVDEDPLEEEEAAAEEEAAFLLYDDRCAAGGDRSDDGEGERLEEVCSFSQMRSPVLGDQPFPACTATGALRLVGDVAIRHAWPTDAIHRARASSSSSSSLVVLTGGWFSCVLCGPLLSVLSNSLVSSSLVYSLELLVALVRSSSHWLSRALDRSLQLFFSRDLS
jgi:hypothetical protein